MEYRVFLGKYRVPTTKSAQWWEARRSHLGVIYEAEEIESGRQVALELIPAFLLGEEERAELEKAARAARQIRHPNIPTLYEFGVEGEQFVSARERLGGMTARVWIARRGPTPIATALGVALQVVSALRAAARCDLYHPVIHPASLMIVPGQRAEGGGPLVKVLQFVAPQPTSRAFALSNPTLDPTAFVSPEQMSKGTADFQSATYSLGATVWFLLSGAAPVASLDRREKKPTIDSDRAMRKFPGLPERVAYLLAGMMAEDREVRPPNPSALEEQIRSAMAEVDHEAMLQPTLTVRPDRPVVPPPEPKAGPPLGLKLAATLAAVAVTAAGLAVLVSAEPFAGWRIESEAKFRANEAGPEVPPRGAALAGKAGSPSAMNFSVDLPSYQQGRSQIQSVESTAGQTVEQTSADRAEPSPPAEGPEGPIVELATSGKHALLPRVVQPPTGQLESNPKKTK
ncbi:MAG TPA: protein kinase [Chthoniobacterales bacterium]|jgi:serine/threonine-protein kinase|nr:protein kinase [Chthoniobacterales bacterium]